MTYFDDAGVNFLRFILDKILVPFCRILLENRHMLKANLAWIIHESVSRDRADGPATRQPQGLESEAYLDSTSQGSRTEDDWKEGHIHGRSS